MDKDILKDLTYGMYVITANYNGNKVGCFVNTICQITSEDVIISVSVNKKNYTNEAIKVSKKFAVAVLSTATNKEVIGKFGFYSSKDTNKFKGFKTLTRQGLPVINENICGYMVCELIKTVSVGTHDIFLARVTEFKKLNNLEPMTYSYYHTVIKGTAPKTAPTYIEDKKVETKQTKTVTSKAKTKTDAKTTGAGNKKFKCVICGHIYDEAKEGTRFEDLPEDWVCPLCGMGKDCFEEVK